MIIFYMDSQIAIISKLSVHYIKYGQEYFYSHKRSYKSVLCVLSRVTPLWSIEL